MVAIFAGEVKARGGQSTVTGTSAERALSLAPALASTAVTA
jgi:hypothetical protein